MAPDRVRPGVSSALKLWDSSTLSDWDETMNSYEECVDIINKTLKKSQVKLSNTSFIDDDRWKESKLPKLLKTQRHIKLDQLVRLMAWKLRRGQYRPTLMGLIRKNTDKSVIEASTKAFELVMTIESQENISEAFSILISLQGVGPATASLILSVLLPESVPFMSDEAMDTTLGLPRSYTLAQYKKLYNALSEKLSILGDDWTLDMIEKSLFTAAVLARGDG